MQTNLTPLLAASVLDEEVRAARMSRRARRLARKAARVPASAVKLPRAPRPVASTQLQRS